MKNIPHPRALDVTALEPHRLRIRWNTGETLDVDLSTKLSGLACLAHILEPDAFAKARAGENGLTIYWDDQAELGADNVYAWSREQLGEASHEMFDGWMHRNGLSLTAAADALGLSRRMVAYYRTGTKPIPRVVWLACAGWEAQHRRHTPNRKAA